MKSCAGDSREMKLLCLRYRVDGNGLLFRDDPIARKEPVAPLAADETDLCDALGEEAEPLSAEAAIDERLAKALANLEDGGKPSFH